MGKNDGNTNACPRPDQSFKPQLVLLVVKEFSLTRPASPLCTGVLHTHLKSFNYVGKVEVIFRLGYSVSSSVDAMSLTIKKFAVSIT